MSAKGNVRVAKREDAWNEVCELLPARFGLKWPSGVVEALRENLVQLNPEEGRKKDEMREMRRDESGGERRRRRTFRFR